MYRVPSVGIFVGLIVLVVGSLAKGLAPGIGTPEQGQSAGIQSCADASVPRDLVPVTSPPQRPEWRIGFTDGKGTFLIELKPDNEEIRKECDELTTCVFEANVRNPLAWASTDARVALFPFSQATKLNQASIVNPARWSVIDMRGNLSHVHFSFLSAILGDEFSGYWYMGSESFKDKGIRFLRMSLLEDGNPIVATTQAIEFPPKISRPTSKAFSLVPHEGSGMLHDPNSKSVPKWREEVLHSKEMRGALGDNHSFLIKVLDHSYGNSMRVVLSEGKGPETLWLIGWQFAYEEENNVRLKSIFGLFKEEGARLKPLLLSNLGELGDCVTVG